MPGLKVTNTSSTKRWYASCCLSILRTLTYSLQPFVTISNILEESRCQRVNAAVARLNKQLIKANRDLSRDVEVMVLCTYQDSEPVIGYYLVKLTTQTLMWFEPVHHDLVTQAGRQPVSLPHLRTFLSVFEHVSQ